MRKPEQSQSQLANPDRNKRPLDEVPKRARRKCVRFHTPYQREQDQLQAEPVSCIA
jgi:hypothetical protein